MSSITPLKCCLCSIVAKNSKVLFLHMKVSNNQSANKRNRIDSIVYPIFHTFKLKKDIDNKGIYNFGSWQKTVGLH